jgi:hypothetical protein
VTRRNGQQDECAGTDTSTDGMRYPALEGGNLAGCHCVRHFAQIERDLPFEHMDGDRRVGAVRVENAARSEANEREAQGAFLHKSASNALMSAVKLSAYGLYFFAEIKGKEIGCQAPVDGTHGCLPVKHVDFIPGV